MFKISERLEMLLTVVNVVEKSREDLVSFYDFQSPILNVDFLKILLENGSET